MIIANVRYTGALRTEARHIRSGNTVITDAPVDNQGRGEAFSPTDLLCTALADCMFTIMGITANARGIVLDGSTADVAKHMTTTPRKVGRIEVHFRLPAAVAPEARPILERAAHTCPVALSLHPDLEQVVTFTYDQ